MRPEVRGNTLLNETSCKKELMHIQVTRSSMAIIDPAQWNR